MRGLGHQGVDRPSKGRSFHRARLLAAAAAAGLSSWVATPRAAAQTWVGSGGGNFSGSFLTASNWAPAFVPQPTSVATFSLNQTYTVTFGADVTNLVLNFSNASGVTTFNSGTGLARTYTLLSAATFAGSGGATLASLGLNVPGVLTVRTGNTLRAQGDSALIVGGLRVGDATVGAPASALVLDGTLLLNKGVASVTNGTLTASNASSGTVGGSMTLGNGATLNVLSGATLGVGNLGAGNTSGDKATINVQGAGSKLIVAAAGTNNGATQVGGSAGLTSLNILSGGSFDGSDGVTFISASGAMTVNGGTFNSQSTDVTGLFTATNGGHVSVQGQFIAGFAGSSGAGTVNVGGANTSVTADTLMLGVTALGTLNQTGGTVSTRVTSVGATAVGAYKLSGGTLTSNEVSIVGIPFLTGVDDDGTLTQSGGTINAQVTFRVAAANSPGDTGHASTSTGTYTLTAGTLTTPKFWVGNSAIGVVTQSGGSVSATTELAIGGLVSGTSAVTVPNATGEYKLSGGGTLTAPTERVGWTRLGTFTQSGGTNTVTSRLILGDTAPGIGNYNISGGTLNALAVTVGNLGQGTFSQSGGSVNVSGASAAQGLLINNGVYRIFAGAATLNVPGTLAIGGTGEGTLTQDGGSVTAAKLLIGNSPFQGGSYLMFSGALSTTSVTVGLASNGLFQLAGGTHTAGTLRIGSGAGTGNYNVLGGTLNATDVIIGADDAAGAGSLSQNGGTITVGNAFSVGESGTGHVGYALSTGSISAPAGTISSFAADRPAIVTQDGGSATFGVLSLAGSGASYSLSAGDLRVQSDLGVTGGSRFTVQGNATQTVGGTISVGPDATYLLAGGTVTASLINVRPGGTFFLAGGRLVAGAMMVRGTLDADTPAPLDVSTTLLAGSATSLFSDLTIAGTVTLQSASVLDGNNVFGRPRLIVQAAGVLAGDGAVVPSIINNGVIEARSGALALHGTSLANTGTLRNAPGASLFVDAAALTNSGTVTVNAGFMTFRAPLASKSLTLAGGTLATPLLTNTNGGSIRGFGQITGDLDNAGAIEFLGPTQVVGNFTNRVGATLLVRNDQTLITGQSVNNGTITTVNGRVIFDGGLTTPVAAAVPGGAAAAAAAAPLPTGGGVDGAGTLALAGPSTLVTSYVRQRSLTLAGTTPAAPAVASIRPRAFGGRTSVVNDLSIPTAGNVPLGRLDLVDTALVVDYAPADASPLATVRALVVSGFHGGDWAGNGLASSAAAADRGKALGYAEAADALHLSGGATGAFAGVTADASAVLVRYTLLGDATLDGAVDFNDLVKLAQNYNTGSGERLWPQGDFTYDGVVDFNDLVKLAQNYNTALPSAPIPGAPANFDADLARAFAGVPEPAAWVAPAGALALSRLTSRQRRRTLRGSA